MEEAKLQRSSIKISAHRGRGDPFVCRRCPGFLHRAAAAVCARAGRAVATVGGGGVATAKIAENHIENLAAAAPKAATALGARTGRHRHPLGGSQSLAAAHRRSLAE
jgi:hypothetical protein